MMLVLQVFSDGLDEPAHLGSLSEPLSIYKVCLFCLC